MGQHRKFIGLIWHHALHQTDVAGSVYSLVAFGLVGLGLGGGLNSVTGWISGGGIYALLAVPGVYMLTKRVWEGSQAELVTLQSRIADLSATRPVLEVTPRTHNYNETSIEVQNLGARATVTAQVEILSGQDTTTMIAQEKPFRYIGCWRHSSGREAVIDQGHSDDLRIAEWRINSMTSSYRFYRFHPSMNAIDHFDSDAWGIIPNFPQLRDRIAYPEIRLRVVISSSPSPVGGPVVREYLLADGEGLTDATTQVSP